MSKHEVESKEDLLLKLQDVEFCLNQVSSDSLDSVPAAFLNKAKNTIVKLVADGKRKIDERLDRAYDAAHRDGSQY